MIDVNPVPKSPDTTASPAAATTPDSGPPPATADAASPSTPQDAPANRAEPTKPTSAATGQLKDEAAAPAETAAPTSSAEPAPTAAAAPAPSQRNSKPTKDGAGSMMSHAACTAALQRHFPALFGPGSPVRPLKLHIQADIQARAPGIFTKQALSHFLRRYTGSPAYLNALTQSRQRYDLDGQPAGPLSDEHRQLARDEMARRRQAHEAERAQADEARRARARLLRDFETTTLTRANFLALKGLDEASLEAQLAQARQDAAQRPPPFFGGPGGGGPGGDRRPPQARRGEPGRRHGSHGPQDRRDPSQGGDRAGARDARPARGSRDDRPRDDRPRDDRPRQDRRDGRGAPHSPQGQDGRRDAPHPTPPVARAAEAQPTPAPAPADHDHGAGSASDAAAKPSAD